MTHQPADDRFSIAPDWPGRAGALARLVIFAAGFMAASYGFNVLLAGVQRHIATLEGHILLSMAAIGVATMILIAIMARVSGRPFGWYGYAGSGKVRNFTIGTVCAIALLATQLSIEAALGCLSFGQVTADAGTLARFGLFYAVLFLVVGFTEESLFRGYGLIELSRAISFWPTVLLSAVAFGLPHWLKGEGETAIGGIQAGLFGLALAYAFRETGSLWFAIGVHAGWDYGETFIFGVPDSALKLKGSVLHPAIAGPHWLTGGTAGPEGSVLALLPIAGFALVAWQLGRWRSPSASSSPLEARAGVD